MADLTSHEAPAHKAAALPVSVPAKLVGRDALLGKVYTQLKENKPVLLYGAPGAGKTAFAATLAAAYTEQPGGVLWLNVRHSRIEELIVRVGRAYGVREISNSDNPLGMLGAAANTLTQHKPLIVLDGELDESVATTFLDRCAAGLPALVVMPEEITDAWTSFAIDNLETPKAATLFRQVAGLPETADVDALVELLQGLPLAVVIAAAALRASKQEPAAFLDLLRRVPVKSDPAVMAATLAIKGLNNALQGVVLVMGATFGRETSAEMLSLISSAPQTAIEQAMTMLVHQRLVEKLPRYDMTFYRLHPVVHELARTLAGTERLAALQSKTREAVVTYTEQYSDAEQYDRLAAEMDTILATARWAAEQSDRETAQQLILALTQAGDFITARGYVYELLQLRQLTALTTPFPAYPPEVPAAAEAADDDEDEAAPDFIRDMFEAQTALTDDEIDEEDEGEADEDSEFDVSLYDVDEDEDDEAEDDFDYSIDDSLPVLPEEELIDAQAVTAAPPADIAALRNLIMDARQNTDLKRQSALLKQLGELQIAQGMENEAIPTYNEAAACFETLGDEPELLDVLDTVSALMVRTENAQPAIMNAMRGVQLAEKLNDRETQMQMLITLGDARQQLGESGDAERSYGQALAIARDIGDTQNEAIILFKLGYAQLDNGDPQGASSTWEQALNLFRAQGKMDYEGRVLGGLGTAYGELDMWSEAIRFHTSALHIARSVNDREEEQLQLENLAYALVQAEQLGQAVLRYRQALHLAYTENDRENVVSTIVDLAGLLTRSPRYLSIALLLVEDALTLEPNDRDLLRLQERINNEVMLHTANGVELAAVGGTARDYAAKAYVLLDEG